MSNLIGKNYEVVKELRRGAWVSVYEARHIILGRRTLIKWLNPSCKEDKELVGRLKREARLGASVDHPNVARIYEVGEADSRPYVAIEWIEGEDLSEVLERESSYTIEKALVLSKDLLAGLNAIHKAGIVHRDLSPMKVRITSEGKARITDFGLATGPFNTNYTLPGAIVGTPGYLAPEQAAGKEVDVRADLFACGVLIHESINGTGLFKHDDLIETIKKVKKENAPPLEAKYQDLPKGFDKWLSQLLAKKPENRFSSAEEALKAFGKVAGIEINKEEIQSVKSFKPYAVGGISLLLILAAAIFVPGYLSKEVQIDPIPVEETLSQDSSSTLTEENSAPPVTDPEPDKDQLTPIPIEENNTPQSSTQITELGRGSTAEVEVVDTNPVISEPPVTIDSAEVSIENSPDSIDRSDGWLEIHTQPWSNVYIGAERIGSTPNLPIFQRPYGPIELTFANPGFPPIPIDTTVYGGDTLKIMVNLIDRVSSFQISASPWASIYIDDSHVSETPLKRPIYLPPGTHKIRFEHPEFGKIEREIKASAGQTLVIHADMLKEGINIASDNTENN